MGRNKGKGVTPRGSEDAVRPRGGILPEDYSVRTFQGEEAMAVGRVISSLIPGRGAET